MCGQRGGAGLPGRGPPGAAPGATLACGLATPPPSAAPRRPPPAPPPAPCNTQARRVCHGPRPPLPRLPARAARCGSRGGAGPALPRRSRLGGMGRCLHALGTPCCAWAPHECTQPAPSDSSLAHRPLPPLASSPAASAGPAGLVLLPQPECGGAIPPPASRPTLCSPGARAGPAGLVLLRNLRRRAAGAGGRPGRGAARHPGASAHGGWG